MRLPRTLAAAAAVVVALAGCGDAARTGRSSATTPTDAKEPHFSYEGATGPSHWGRLSADWQTCGNGRRQSPVDLGHATAATLPPLRFVYRSSKVAATDTGHTINFAPDVKDVLRVDGRAVGTLQQLHFHAPSEHKVNGRAYAMEFHFVHADKQGRLTVVGVFVRPGPANAAIDAISRDLPEGENAMTTGTLDPRSLMPASHRTVRYSGSLTTPPCTEGVRWIVLTTPITMSAKQIARFREVHEHNRRPLEPVGGRVLRRGA